MIYSPHPVTRPSIPSGEWKKVNTLTAGRRKFLSLSNEDVLTTYRFELLPTGSTGPTLATAGRPLSPAVPPFLVGGTFTEDFDAMSSGDVWVYQDSGDTLATLAVLEGE